MEQVWASRLRWRVRGAWQWPAFAFFVVGDAVLLHELPISGDSGPEVFGALLLSGFFNFAAFGAGGAVGGLLLRRWRPELRRLCATARAATGAMAAMALLLAGLGLAHRRAAQADRAALAAGLARVRLYVAHNASAEFRRHIDEATSIRFGDTLYRTCVPGDAPRRALCLFVSTDQSPPGISLDPSRAPNSQFLPADQTP